VLSLPLTPEPLGSKQVAKIEVLHAGVSVVFL
jgi:hypothetical protein